MPPRPRALPLPPAPPRPLVRFAFGLPPILALAVAPGRYQPCIAFCRLDIDPSGLVVVAGPSRELVFVMTVRFLKVIANDQTPILSIPATLITPPPVVDHQRCGLGGRDSYSIVVASEITIVCSAIAPVVEALRASRQS